MSPTDCPQCGTLCLGATILQCGHLVCRKCLHGVLSRQHHLPSCHTCGHQLRFFGDSVSDLVQEFGADPVMDHLVDQRLLLQGRQKCLVCDNRDATMICHDCKESYCDGCSTAHRKMGVTTDHFLQRLPQSLRNTSSASRTGPRPRSDSLVSTISEESIRNFAEAHTRDKPRGYHEWKQWVGKEVDLLRQAASDQDTVKDTLNDVISLIQQLLDTVETEQQEMESYADCLTQYEMTDQINSRTFVVSQIISDASVEVKIEALEQRLQDVRKRRQLSLPVDVEKMKDQLQDLIHRQDGMKNQDIPSVRHSDRPEEASQRPSTTVFTPPGARYSPIPVGKSRDVPVMMATAHKVLVSQAVGADDTMKPAIEAIISTADNKLVMTDIDNKRVKVLDLADPGKIIPSPTLCKEPRRLALLSDGLVAVTTGTQVLYLMQVSSRVSVTSELETDRQYIGVADHREDMLIVSCEKTGREPARIDIITRFGDVVRMVVDSSRLPELERPYYLCVDDGHVLVSDWQDDLLHKVDIGTGRLSVTLRHTDLRFPLQKCVDRAGNLYVASGDGQCVLVRSVEGRWRQLLRSDQHSEQGCYWPWGVCVTQSGHVVVAWHRSGSHSIVIVYALE